MTISAILLDTKTRSLRTVEIERASAYARICELIEADHLDVVRIDSHNDICVDDCGMLDPIPCFTRLEGYPTPLAGNLLFGGHDQEGNLAAPTLAIEEIAEMLTIHYPLLEADFATTTEPGIISTAIVGFRVRLETAKPSIE